MGSWGECTRVVQVEVVTNGYLVSQYSNKYIASTLTEVMQLIKKLTKEK